MISAEKQRELSSILGDRLRSKKDTSKLASYAASYIRDIFREYPELTSLPNVVEILKACSKHLGEDSCGS